MSSHLEISACDYHHEWFSFLWQKMSFFSVVNEEWMKSYTRRNYNEALNLFDIVEPFADISDNHENQGFKSKTFNKVSLYGGVLQTKQFLFI